MSFVHTHLHTEYSNNGMMDAISKVDNIIPHIDKLGQTAWAITDHNGCSGLLEGYIKTQKYNKKHNTNIKFIFGAELYYTYDVTIKDNKLYHILFLAKNETGYLNLIQLDSIAQGDNGKHPENFYRKGRLDFDIISKYSEGLICTSACMGGILREENAFEVAKKFKDLFKNDFYIELHTYQIEEQKEYNKKVLEIARQLNISTIACCDSHYIDESQYILHKQFRGISDSDEDNYYQSNDFYIQSEEEVREKLSYLPLDIINQSIDNTAKIAGQCNVEIKFGQKLYPSYPCEDIEKEFRKVCSDGYRRKRLGKISGKQKKEYDDRIRYEVKVLKKLGYFDYFLINWDYLVNCCEKRNIPRGCGRGSVGGCECAYLMDITKLDAVTNKLFFERFANPQRISVPDIDSDVSKLHRHEVIEYIKEKYGNVYQVRVFSYMKARGALKRAGQALGLEAEYVNEVSKKIIKIDTSDDEEEINDTDLQLLMLDNIRDENNKELIDLAKNLVGILQGFSKHASCVLVLSEDILKYCPLERQVDSKTHEVNYVAAYNYKYLEEIGMMKLDVLGLRTLDVIQETLESIKEKIDIFDLSRQDEKTLKLLQEGDTLGVFQLKSYGIVKTLKEIHPTHFNDVMHTVALYRPGCIISGGLQMYLDRRSGRKEVIYKDERLKPILDETQGCIVYQEQVMEIVKILAGYSMAEADMVRRGMGKKDADYLREIMSEFVQRAIDNGTNPEYAEEIAKDIQVFSGYAFNKAHSEKYGYLSYITAFLKAHYPVQFYCATINSKENQEDILPFIKECKSKNIIIYPPDVRYSKNQWTIENNGLRMGLSYIKGINSIQIDSSWTTFANFAKHLPKNKLEPLIKSGSLDSYDTREHLISLVDTMLNYNKEIKHCEERMSYFSSKGNQPKVNEWQSKLSALTTPKPKDIPYDSIAAEVAVLGMSFQELPRIKEGTITRVFIKNDKKGHEMAFVDIDSNYGQFKGVIFASNWKFWKKFVQVGNKSKFIIEDGVIKDIKEVK